MATERVGVHGSRWGAPAAATGIAFAALAGRLIVALLVVHAFVQLVGGPDSTDALGTGSFLAFVAWVLAASILLSRSSARAAAAPSTTLAAAGSGE